MPQPIAPVDICNLTQDALGQEPITSITPGSTQTETMYARQYDQCRRWLLRSYVWRFAKQRTLLAHSRTPEFDYQDAYALPADFLRLLNVGGGQSPTGSTTTPLSAQGTDEQWYLTDYDIENNPAGGMEILCNNAGANGLPCRYIANITDPTKFDPGFIRALTLELAVACAYQITKSEAVVKRVNELYTVEIPLIISINGQEHPPTKVEKSKFVESRRWATTGNSGVASKWTEFD